MAWAGILFLLLDFAHLNRKDNQTYCSGNMLKINNLHSDHNISVNIELIIQLNSNYILKHETEKKTFPLLFITKAAQNCSAHSLFLKCQRTPLTGRLLGLGQNYFLLFGPRLMIHSSMTLPSHRTAKRRSRTNKTGQCALREP
jgi:hypothetical protein